MGDMEDTAGIVGHMLAIISDQVVGVIQALAPIGQDIAGSLVVLAIVFLGVSVMSGASILGPIVRMTALASSTYWLLGVWPDLVLGTLQFERNLIGLVVPGYAGPTGLFHAGNAIAARMMLQDVAWSLNPLQMGANALFLAASALLVWAGFAVVSVVAIVAEIQMLLGAAVAPLVLPFLALGFTASIGAAPLRYLISSTVRCVVLGVICSVITGAASQVMSVAGTDQVLGTSEVLSLLALSLTCAVLAVGCGQIANGLTSGGAGSMGYSSVQHAGSVVGGAVSTASSAAAAAGSAAGSASRAIGAATGGAGSVSSVVSRSSGGGNPFSNTG